MRGLRDGLARLFEDALGFLVLPPEEILADGNSGDGATVGATGVTT